MNMTKCTRLNFETGKLLKFRNSKFFGGCLLFLKSCDLCAFLTIKDHNDSVTIKDHNDS